MDTQAFYDDLAGEYARSTPTGRTRCAAGRGARPAHPQRARRCAADACSTVRAASARRPSASRWPATTCSRPTSRPCRSCARGARRPRWVHRSRSASPTSRASPSRWTGRSRACSPAATPSRTCTADEDLGALRGRRRREAAARRPRARQPARLRGAVGRARRRASATALGPGTISFQLWDWDADGRSYELAQFTLRGEGESWQTNCRRTRLRAWRRAELCDALGRGGPLRRALAHAGRDRLLPADRDGTQAVALPLPSRSCASRRSPTASLATTRRPGTSIASRRSGGRAATTSSCSRSAIPTSRRRRSSSRPRTPRCAPGARTTRSPRAIWRCVRRSRSAHPPGPGDLSMRAASSSSPALRQRCSRSASACSARATRSSSPSPSTRPTPASSPPPARPRSTCRCAPSGSSSSTSPMSRPHSASARARSS